MSAGGTGLLGSGVLGTLILGNSNNAFCNLSFEAEGGAGDPMSPIGWVAAITSTGEEIAGFDTYLEAFEDFEEGWHAAIPSLVPSANPYTSPHALATSNAGPYALQDVQVIQFTRDGINLRTIVFNSVDFDNIAEATAAEVQTVMQASLSPFGYVVDDVGNRLRVRSSPFGEAIAVVGQGTANNVLGFPVVYDAFVGPNFDLESAPWADVSNINDFETLWAGIAAHVTSGNKEPFAVDDGDILTIRVNGVDTVVTFTTLGVSGAATADELAVYINTALSTGVATAVAGTDLVISTDLKATGASISIPNPGEDAAIALDFYPASGDAISDGFSSVLPSSVAMTFDVTVPENFEDFEEEWSNGDTTWLWVLTLDRINVTSAVSGSVYTVVLSNTHVTETYAYTALAADTVSDIGAALTTKLGASALLTAVDLGSGVIETTRTDTRTVVDYTVTGNAELGSASTSGTIVVSEYDGTNDDFEDFEEEWLNDDGTWLWHLTPQYARVLTAVVGRVYSVTLDDADNEVTFSYTALGGDGVTQIATALAALVTADSRYTSVYVAPDSLSLINDDTRTHLDPSFSAAVDLEHWVDEVDASIAPADFGVVAGTSPYEDFEDVLGAQIHIVFGAVSPVAAGTWSFSILGEVFSLTFAGTESMGDVAASFQSAIASSSIKNIVNADNVSVPTRVIINSIACPKIELNVSNISSPGNVMFSFNINGTQYWDDFHTMCSI